MPKNIFVIGLEPYGLRKLQRIRHAESYCFHPLLDYREVVKPLDYPYEAMLQKADERLRRFPGSVDAIVSYWDFPADTMAAILCRRFGLPSTSLESVLKCGHKYWARLEQQKIIPGHIPAFRAFDPFAEDPLHGIDLDFPFWIKPIKSFSSYLGFYIDSRATFDRHLPVIRRNLPRIGDAFNVALSHARLPEEVRPVGGNHCIAEAIIRGDRQNGPEGYVVNGEVHVNGITDTRKDARGRSFTSYEYPSDWPRNMQRETIRLTKRLVSRIGLSNCGFNLEFIWNEATDDLMLIELNPRISQSLSGMFERVHGTSNHEFMVELALGQKPDYPRAEGRFKCAAKFMWRRYGNAFVKRAPSTDELAQIHRMFPDAEVYIEAREGSLLSDLKDQDSYSYEIAIILLGADSHRQLMEKYARCRKILTFEFADAGDGKFAEAG